MGEIKIRRLDDQVVHALKARARADGLSLEEEARRILTDAVRQDRMRILDRAAALRRMSGGTSSAELDSVRIIREERDAMG